MRKKADVVGVDKGKPLEAYKVWRRIRGVATHESRQEFFVMKISTEEEEAEVAAGRTNRFPWMDFFTKPRARRAIIYANIMIFLGQFTGINAILYYMVINRPKYAQIHPLILYSPC